MTKDDALATLTEIKDYYQFGNTRQIDDDLLTDLSIRVTAIFQTYCQVGSFKIKNFEEVVDGYGDMFLFVSNKPIVEIQEINYSDEWDWTLESIVDPDTYAIRDSLYIASKTVWNRRVGAYRVKYTAGYTTIPPDLKQVAIEEVIRRYNHRKDFDVIAKQLDDGNVTYTEKGLLTSTKEVLNKYKNNWIL